MATLTTDEIADFRLVVGDDELQHDNEYIVSDEQAQTLYDKAESNFALTCVFWLRRIVGYCRRMVPEESVAAGSRARFDVLYQNSKDLLTYWTEQYRSNSGTGLGEGTTIEGDVNTDANSPEGLGVFDLGTTSDYAVGDRAAGWYT